MCLAAKKYQPLTTNYQALNNFEIPRGEEVRYQHLLRTFLTVTPPVLDTGVPLERGRARGKTVGSSDPLTVALKIFPNIAI